MGNDVGALGPIAHGAFGDRTTAALEQALAGLSARQRATADNIANIQTPGYRAKRVDFESSLAAALDGGDPRAARTSMSTSTTETRTDGNNVDLDEETITLTKVGLSYQTMVQAMDHKLRLLRSTIGG